MEPEKKSKWQHGDFKGNCTKPGCKEPAKHRLCEQDEEKWGDYTIVVLLKSRCQKHWLKLQEKIKLKKAKK